MPRARGLAQNDKQGGRITDGRRDGRTNAGDGREAIKETDLPGPATVPCRGGSEAWARSGPLRSGELSWDEDMMRERQSAGQQVGARDQRTEQQQSQ